MTKQRSVKKRLSNVGKHQPCQFIAVYAFPATVLQVVLCGFSTWLMSSFWVAGEMHTVLQAIFFNHQNKQTSSFPSPALRGIFANAVVYLCARLRGRLSCRVDEQRHGKSSRLRTLLEVINCKSPLLVPIFNQTCTFSDSLKDIPIEAEKTGAVWRKFRKSFIT